LLLKYLFANAASLDERAPLFTAAFQASQNQPSRGRAIFSVSDPTVFDGNVVFLAEEILL
jgi:hypothetical protein